jgi:hypothetical protein
VVAKVSHRCRDLLDVHFQREMSGIQELNSGVRIVSTESFRAGRYEISVVLPPYRELVVAISGDRTSNFGTKVIIDRIKEVLNWVTVSS